MECRRSLVGEFEQVQVSGWPLEVNVKVWWLDRSAEENMFEFSCLTLKCFSEHSELSRRVTFSFAIVYS